MDRFSRLRRIRSSFFLYVPQFFRQRISPARVDVLQFRSDLQHIGVLPHAEAELLAQLRGANELFGPVLACICRYICFLSSDGDAFPNQFSPDSFERCDRRQPDFPVLGIGRLCLFLFSVAVEEFPGIRKENRITADRFRPVPQNGTEPECRDSCNDQHGDYQFSEMFHRVRILSKTMTAGCSPAEG